uniref:Nodule-specific cysteine-rich peptide G48 n=1 Tax=Pisum sativum TaxID=3888 RepID=A0A7T8DVA8_PEA|nr:nodule-specific cysteine-rich peptide G48 [Pisum sativum]
MARVLKFIYTLIIFVSLIILVSSKDQVLCVTDKECRHNTCDSPFVSKCRMFFCLCGLA